MLDVECSVRGSPETYIPKVRLAHKSNARLLEPSPGQTAAFSVQHYAGRVAYSAADFLGKGAEMKCVCLWRLLVCLLEGWMCSGALF